MSLTLIKSRICPSSMALRNSSAAKAELTIAGIGNMICLFCLIYIMQRSYTSQNSSYRVGSRTGILGRSIPLDAASSAASRPRTDGFSSVEVPALCFEPFSRPGEDFSG